MHEKEYQLRAVFPIPSTLPFVSTEWRLVAAFQNQKAVSRSLLRRVRTEYVTVQTHPKSIPPQFYGRGSQKIRNVRIGEKQGPSTKETILFCPPIGIDIFVLPLGIMKFGAKKRRKTIVALPRLASLSACGDVNNTEYLEGSNDEGKHRIIGHPRPRTETRKK